MTGVTYIAISGPDYDALKRATERPEMVGISKACEMFDVSVQLLNDLVNAGRLTRYGIPGHPRTSRFKVSDLQNLFKPI